MSTDYRLDPRVRILLLDIGLDPNTVLRRAQLPEDLFSRVPIRLGQSEFFALWQAVEDEADNPNLPIHIAENVSAEAFDPAIFAALASPNLNVAAQRVATYKRLLGPARVNVAVSSTDTAIGIVWPDGVQPPSTFTLTEVLFWVAVVRLATRHEVRPLRVTVPEPPADQDVYRRYLGVTVERRPSVGLTFASADAERPFLMASDAMWAAFEPGLRKRLADINKSDSFADRVRAALLELLPSGESSMTEVGRRLALSTRTLHRRLEAEGTTFQVVLNDTRESLARHYLVNEDLSSGEIAFLLGYDEPSSFFRAFQSWTGRTPAQIRDAGRAKTQA